MSNSWVAFRPWYQDIKRAEQEMSVNTRLWEEYAAATDPIIKKEIHIKLFVRVMGCTPEQYRANRRVSK